ncbi:hypothetical protein C2G38_677534 [Gigaspora rosea]|uniref:Uncharacterized protein n=1 Tax=Gigaspora rosea TaxID=44941 RepID=A0A397UBE9_9GLOM|nr:hypothetical protein C2G38_677534 [Gigaspora rosea]
MVRNDGTPDEKKFLGVILRKIKNPYTRQQHDLRSAKIIAMINKGYNYPSPGEYKEYYLPNNWIERKKEQLNNRLSLVSYIVAFIELHWHGYRIIEYSGWTYMLKWLSNPEYYHINKFGNESIVKSSEYALYVCKLYGRTYPSDLLKIYYFETKYLNILGEEINIDFSNPNNNCEYVRQIFWSIDSSPNLIAKGLSTGLVKSKTTNSRSRKCLSIILDAFFGLSIY